MKRTHVRMRKRAVALAGAAALLAPASVLVGAGPADAATQQLYADSSVPKATQYSWWGDDWRSRYFGVLSTTPTAKWLSYYSSSPTDVAHVRSTTAAYVSAGLKAGKVPQLVVYGIPDRDCAQYSNGGTPDYATYGTWVSNIAAGIADAMATTTNQQEVLVLLEPDSLALQPSKPGTLPKWYNACDVLVAQRAQSGNPLPANYFDQRNAAISSAVDALEQVSAARVGTYLDAGHSAWYGQYNTADIVTRLKAAGLAKADGFFSNTSNYQWASNEVAYGTTLLNLLGSSYAGKKQVIDTSRSGAGPGTFSTSGNLYRVDGVPAAPLANGITKDYQVGTGPTPAVPATGSSQSAPYQYAPDIADNWESWCDLKTAKVGPSPQLNDGTLATHVKAYVWIKPPGETDGCATGYDVKYGQPKTASTAAGTFSPDMACLLLKDGCPVPSKPDWCWWKGTVQTYAQQPGYASKYLTLQMWQNIGATLPDQTIRVRWPSSTAPITWHYDSGYAPVTSQLDRSVVVNMTAWPRTRTDYFYVSGPTSLDFMPTSVSIGGTTCGRAS